MASDAEIRHAIEHGVSFSGKRPDNPPEGHRIKTKARSKSYKTGAHHSEATQKKAQKSQKRFLRIQSHRSGRAHKD